MLNPFGYPTNFKIHYPPNQMKTIDKTAPVLVTGATGYVAGRLIEKLLTQGLTVHAAVRDPNNPEKLKHLNELANKLNGSIRYFKSELLEKGSYAHAMQGCELVYHTASPFTSKVNDPQRDLVDPALIGTQNVLRQAAESDSIKRIVLTSSCAAIYGDNADLKSILSGVFTEANWNTTSSLENGAYSYSKTIAEKEAWRISKSQDRWDLVTINPSLVLGPGINPKGTSESFNLITQLGNGTLKSGVPDIGMGVVDVRDVATAHYLAGFTPAAQGRYIISGHNSSFLEIAEILKKKYGNDFPIPKKRMPKTLVWLFGPMINPMITRSYVSRNVNLPWNADHSKSIKELGMTYRPMEVSVTEFFEQIFDIK